MILIRKIEIFEFRGIRHLEIDFKKKNFAICGKNGTGKSGIVDAVEFGLIGDISRLAGSGTGGISLKEHAPHVDFRNDPSQSKVIVTVYIPSLSKEVTIERCVADIHNPTIKPGTPDILAILNEVSMHPEFTLSRRELIKYVISAPSDRAKQVQVLLRLEKIETLRAALQKIANADKNAVPPLKKQKDEAKQELLTALGITEFKTEKILQAVNDWRVKLGLPELTELTPSTSFRTGLTEQIAKKPVNISKPHALTEIESLKALLITYATFGKSQDLKDIHTKITALNSDKTALTNLTREEFFQSALALVDDDCCPVCDTDLGIDELQSILKKKLESFETVSAKRTSLVKDMEVYADTLSKLLAEVRVIKEYGSSLKPAIETKQLDEFITVIQTKMNQIKAFLPIDELLDGLNSYGEVPKAVDELIQTIEVAIQAIPEPSQQDAARDSLFIAEGKLESLRKISSTHKQADERSKISLTTSATYGKVVTSTLEDLYKDVEANFTELYRFINEDDESEFTAQLTPSAGKLGFQVDFYGRGYFPPGAYHSEGHQDGMGLCLYLALMKHLLGDNFKFAVLDDVLMSVDTGHRREVCKMLKEKFPDTQFILTTHDEVWLKHMKTAGLIQSAGAMQFRKWDIDHGPNQWNDKDVWGEITQHLKKNDVRAAAALLRHYLEYLCADICDKLKARVEFKGDANYTLGDLLSPATSQLTKLLDEGIKAANSWGKSEVEAKLQIQQTALKNKIATSNLEQWQSNSAIHYNEWANLEEKDFAPVAEAFKNLTEAFTCLEENCNSLFYLTYDKGQKDTLRCSCGTVNINLKKK
ncbi:AAA domain-containing protein [Pedobacter steynii]|uniref:AAA domain-containing protein n=1 Tax=Pedobacter steynii TaxID=430522 RepID=A0A1H0G4V6_9SPHI|nr:AAA family ATPase [Pedobacter steynii]NQX42321.1 AAA family ATPase [Pedobacter steynii]SDO01874.1 AAA domain-containing protein [Pedobacter steynii]